MGSPPTENFEPQEKSVECSSGAAMDELTGFNPLQKPSTPPPRTFPGSATIKTRKDLVCFLILII